MANAPTTSPTRQSAGLEAAEVPSRRELLRGMGMLVAALLLVAVTALPLAWWFGSTATFSAAAIGCGSVLTGCLLSWILTILWRGPLVGLLHVTTGFLLRAGIPFVVAAILLAVDNRWEQAGLHWWCFGFYLVGLVGDTLIFVCLISAESRTPPGAIVQWLGKLIFPKT